MMYLMYPNCRRDILDVAHFIYRNESAYLKEYLQSDRTSKNPYFWNMVLNIKVIVSRLSGTDISYMIYPITDVANTLFLNNSVYIP
jgi:hypothetical protein